MTFAAILIARVIEEQAKGDAKQAASIRSRAVEVLGCSLGSIVPGSAKAQQLKQLLSRQGLWSQYLEVGIGPDAEIFTKAPVLSAVGTGFDIGIHAGSAWNNPKPEIVLAVSSRGKLKVRGWVTMSIFAILRPSVLFCWAKPRTTTHRARLAPSFACLTQGFS